MSDEIALELHQQVIHCGSAIHAQFADCYSRICLHGLQHFKGLIGYAIQGSTGNMCAKWNPGSNQPAFPGHAGSNVVRPVRQMRV